MVDSESSDQREVDPIRTFADRLRRLQADSGGPSVRDLVRLTGKVGSPYTRGTIQDKLAGRSAPPWEFVDSFVRACALHAGASEPDLRPWREWHAEMARAVAAQRTSRRRTIRADVCPYRGLEAFTAEHAEWFHGRAAAVQDVLAALAGHPRGVLLLGPSGAGKSSVIQAGVLPALASGQLPGSDQWITVLARPGKDLSDELDRAGLPGAGDQSLPAAVEQRLAGEPSGSRLLLVIDQFEEILTPAGSDEQASLQRQAIDGLAAAIGTPGLSVILVLRDDFYPRLASEAPEILRALVPGLLNVPATLTTQDLGDIITRPAEAVDLHFQDGLPERITADVLAAGPDRHAPITVLPLLELAHVPHFCRGVQPRRAHPGIRQQRFDCAALGRGHRTPPRRPRRAHRPSALGGVRPGRTNPGHRQLGRHGPAVECRSARPGRRHREDLPIRQPRPLRPGACHLPASGPVTPGRLSAIAGGAGDLQRLIQGELTGPSGRCRRGRDPHGGLPSPGGAAGQASMLSIDHDRSSWAATCRTADRAFRPIPDGATFDLAAPCRLKAGGCTVA